MNAIRPSGTNTLELSGVEEVQVCAAQNVVAVNLAVLVRLGRHLLLLNMRSSADGSPLSRQRPSRRHRWGIRSGSPVK